MHSCRAKSEAQGRVLGWRGVIVLERARNWIVKTMPAALTAKLPASVAYTVLDVLRRLSPKWVLLMNGRLFPK